MSTQRRQRFIHAQVAWMLAVILLLVVLDALELELVFVLSLICSIENGRQQRDHAVMSLGKRGREDGNGSRLARPR